MAEFKRKPMAEELTAALKAGVRDIPAAVVEAEKTGEGKGPRAPKTVQVNFNVTEDFADLISELAREAGSTRRLFARALHELGHPVPQADLEPFDNRRRARKAS
jgi:hypothetical protein